MERITLMMALISGVNCLMLDKLVKEVFSGESYVARPRCGDNKPVEVTLDVALRQIVELDEPHQFLSCIVWIRLEWSDCRLVWNVTNYDDIDSVIVPQNKVWIPDLTLYDNSAADNLKGIKDYNLKVMNTGAVRYQFPSVIMSLCSVDVTHFPFDNQECNLTFGSWAYNGFNVYIKNHSNTADMTSYIKNVEWRVLSVPVLHLEPLYQGEPYPTVTFVIRLQRLPLFYTMNLIFPCALISTVAVLGFLLPPASGEKVNLEITVLLSLAVFQLIVLELMPPTGDSVPFIGIFFVISLLLVGLSCCMTVLVLKIHFEGDDDRRLPVWLKNCCVIPLAKILFYDIQELRPKSSYNPKFQESRVSRFSDDRVKPFRPKMTEDSGLWTGFREADANHVDGNVTENHVTHQSLAGQSTDDTGVASKLESISGQLHNINEFIAREKDSDLAAAEWKIFAVLLDRLFLIVYIVSLVVCGTTVYSTYVLNAPAPNGEYK